MDHRGRTSILSGLVALVLALGLASAVLEERRTAPAGETASWSPALPSPPPSLAAEPSTSAPSSSTSAPSSSTTTTQAPALGRDVSAYRGLGAWVDAFDYAPAYYRPREGPLLVPEDLDAMAARGVRTLFLQAARLDDRSPGGVVDPVLTGAMLKRAHEQGMRVVGWYLPKFADVEADLANLRVLRDLDVEGHRFDGIAVDIEYRRDVPNHAERNRRLIDLSRRFRAETTGLALGAIVYPPVLLEEIRPNFWPDFPWQELAESYDVWLPMVYWTEIAAESSYGDPYRYTTAGTQGLIDNLGDASLLVHSIGGVADTATVDDFESFIRAAREQDSMGFSMYDYRTTSSEEWQVLASNAP